MNRLSELAVRTGRHLDTYGGEFLEKESKGMTEAEADAEFLKRGFALILEHPFVYLN